jgi:phospholipid/cholesterol/gamma-HCH transport system substrate-binding protein
MTTAIRKHLRDFIAVAVLVVVATATSLYIVQQQRLRIPILEEKPFELRAEFETAQAVVPGQGQSLRVAGVKVGDVKSVEVEEGKGVVTFEVDRDFLPIYSDATILMRPTTGLKDMFFDMDPGTEQSGEVDDGGTLPLANTAPDVNIDQILEALDADTQAYLRLLIVGAGKGLEGRGRDFGEVLGSLGPINRSLARLNSKVAQRKENLARLIHNFNLLTQEVGDADDDLAQLVDSSNAALGAIASQDTDVQEAVRLLGPTLEEAHTALDQLSDMASVLGPAFNDLRPFARNLDEMNASVIDLSQAATPVLANQIRPFVRKARNPVKNLRKASKPLAEATPRLTVIGEKINRLGNMAAFNPNGAEPPGTPGRNEGYLFWAGWLGHLGDSIFSAGDAHGLYRRIYLTASCDNLDDLLLEASGEAPEIGRPIFENISGFGPLFAPGGPCNP